MPREPSSNWRFVPPDQVPKPDPRYAALSPAWFLGRFVKLGFPCLQTPDVIEHCWVEVVAVRPRGVLHGRLNNDPVHNIGAVCGDVVAFTRDRIEAVWQD
jgi:hypothetical protein